MTDAAQATVNGGDCAIGHRSACFLVFALIFGPFVAAGSVRPISAPFSSGPRLTFDQKRLRRSFFHLHVTKSRE
jgi:hypothetical protein